MAEPGPQLDTGLAADQQRGPREGPAVGSKQQQQLEATQLRMEAVGSNLRDD